MLPSEWHKQAFVQLTWPHIDTDWAPVLDDAIECYCNMTEAISRHQPLIIIAQFTDKVQMQLQSRSIPTDNITIIECQNNDTWARDHAFITTFDKTADGTAEVQFHDFCFNGWGMKFAANLDNCINRNIYDRLSSKYADTTKLQVPHKYIGHKNFVLEGGSIESDGEGTLLTTSSCLLAPNRNEPMKKEEIEQYLKETFDIRKVLWLDYSWLAGDDTDGHIDTVARLCPNNVITYVKCEDKDDEHYDELNNMEKQLASFTNAAGKPFTLIPLPMPRACHDDDGNRLPATYANFLIMNNAVLYPTYNQPDNDELAHQQLAKAFPGRDIIGINCEVLIIQHGSLHCCTMQYPSVD